MIKTAMKRTILDLLLMKVFSFLKTLKLDN
jgi:hypothetical protein